MDVYLRFTDADPTPAASSARWARPLAASGALSSVPGDGSYRLLPGVLHAYTVTAAELGAFQAPVPESPPPGG